MMKINNKPETGTHVSLMKSHLTQENMAGQWNSPIIIIIKWKGNGETFIRVKYLKQILQTHLNEYPHTCVCAQRKAQTNGTMLLSHIYCPG